MTPTLLARHDGVVLLDKPAGLPSTGRTLDDPRCAQGWLMAHLRRRKVWAVHQLDRDTSGLNVFVLRKGLVAEWSERLRYPRARKTYLALVAGRWRGGPQTIDVPLGHRTVGRKRFAAVDPQGRPARTQVRPLAVGADASLLACTLESGRTHQVRLHLAHAGHPLLGESLHGPAPCARAPRHMLHAWRLELGDGPVNLRFLQSPLPPDFARSAQAHGLALPPGPTWVATCSAAKDPAPGPLPAHRRYTSPRLDWARDQAGGSELWILSGVLGLVPPDAPIPLYDHALQADEVGALVPRVVAALRGSPGLRFVARPRETPGWGPYHRLMEAAAVVAGVSVGVVGVPEGVSED